MEEVKQKGEKPHKTQDAKHKLVHKTSEKQATNNDAETLLEIQEKFLKARVTSKQNYLKRKPLKHINHIHIKGKSHSKYPR